MKAQVKHIEGLQFRAVSDSNHATVLDAGKKFSFDQGSRPKELILMGLIGCTGMDVVSILNKMKVQFDDLAIEAEAESAKEHPCVFTKIDINYMITGENVDESKLKKAIDLSQNKYCPVSAMLKNTVDINYKYEIKKG